MELFIIGHALDIDFSCVHNRGGLVLLFIKADMSVDFQATVICRLAKVIAEVGSENWYGSRHNEGKNK